jgi:hypothetical protein
MNDCPKCGQRHVGRRPCYYDDLKIALGDLELSEREERYLRWLAGWDWETRDVFVELFKRLRMAKPAGEAL